MKREEQTVCVPSLLSCLLGLLVELRDPEEGWGPSWVSGGWLGAGSLLEF